MSCFGPKAVIDNEKAHVYDYKEDHAELESSGSVSAASYDSSRVSVGVPLQPLANMWKNANVPFTPQELEQLLRSQQMPPPHMWMPPPPPGAGGASGANPLVGNPLSGNPMNPLSTNHMGNGQMMGGKSMMPPPPGSQFPPLNFSGAEFMPPPMGMPPHGAFPSAPPPSIWGSNEASGSSVPHANGMPPPGFLFQNSGPWGFPMPSPMTPEQMQILHQLQQQQLQQEAGQTSNQPSQMPQHPRVPQQSQPPSEPKAAFKEASKEATLTSAKNNFKETPKEHQSGPQQLSKKEISRDSLSSSTELPTEPRKASNSRLKEAFNQAEPGEKPYSLTPQSRVTPRSIAETRSDPSAHRVAHFDQYNPRQANRYAPRSEEYYAESEALRPNRRFRHLMTDHDKRYVMDKCVKSMANDDPFVDDYYFHVYTRIHGRERSQREAQKYRRVFLKGEGSTSDKLRQQVQRAVERAQEYRQKRREEDLPLRKSAASASRPRQALPSFDGSNATAKGARSDKRGAELLSGSLSDNSGAPTSEVSAASTLRSIEDAYDSILALEAHAQRRSAPSDPKATDWAIEGPPLQEQLWLRFQVQKPVDKNGKQPFIEILSVPKGMKAFARSWPQFDPTKRLTILTRIVVNIADLSNVKPAHFDLFGQAVVQPVVHLIGDSDMSTVLLMADLARTKAQELALSRVGQLLLTAIVSRAEMLSQDGANLEAKENAAQWGSAFGPLFDAIVPAIGKLDLRDDAIWHFFAALALSSDLERQSELVDLVRTQIFAQQKAAQQLGGKAGEKKIVSLNLFLNVLGLDATLDDIKELDA